VATFFYLANEAQPRYQFSDASGHRTSFKCVHHGTFRHELGNPELQSERGYQLDYSFTYQKGKLSSTLTPFATYYDQYIYLAPTSSFSRLPSGSQKTWEFRQANASFWGGEWVTSYQPVAALKWMMWCN
jgi:iron complex outermembrane receptor protein